MNPVRKFLGLYPNRNLFFFRYCFTFVFALYFSCISRANAQCESITGLDTVDVSSNSVWFRWDLNFNVNSSYEYAVTTDPLPPASVARPTTDTVFVTDLSLATTYFIHVRLYSAESNCEWSVFSFKTRECIAQPSSLGGDGTFCPGEIMNLGMPSTVFNQTYSLLKDKKKGPKLPGDGGGGNVSFNFAFAAEDVGTYSVLAEKPGCQSSEFGNVRLELASAPQNLTTTSVGPTTVSFKWSAVKDFSGNTFVYQYTVDNSSEPPSNNFDNIDNSDTVLTCNFLSPLTDYYLHVKAIRFNNTGDCAWSTLKFTTSFDCDSAIEVKECTEVTAAIPAGEGAWNFKGAYPSNSVNYATPGKEALFSFTPSSTGVYYLQVTSPTVNTFIDYLYKPSSAGCDNTNWIGINNCNGPGKIAIGMLQSGVQYFIVLDNEGTNAVTQAFKICKANTNTDPANLNTCIGYFATAEPIPARSPKEEYFIDDDGHLIASLDFSAVTNSVGYAFADYYINSNNVRKDNFGKEYLDRSITIRTDNAPSVPAKVKVYFKNSELQRLIDEPDDGIADVAGINDLNVTKTSQLCSAVAEDQGPLLMQQSGNGTYDESSSYLQFYSLDLYATFFIHGGLSALFQDTDTSLVCPGGSTTFVMASAGDGYSYQWQVDQGAGFANISANSNYSGVNSTILYLINAPSSLYGYRYRCVATKNNNTAVSKVRTLRFEVTWNGTQSSDWGTGANWTCGVAPDENTDAVIPAGVTNQPIINSNAACRKVSMQTNALLKVAGGFILDIKKK